MGPALRASGALLANSVLHPRAQEGNHSQVSYVCSFKIPRTEVSGDLWKTLQTQICSYAVQRLQAHSMCRADT